jgi:hypothetical protein
MNERSVLAIRSFTDRLEPRERPDFRGVQSKNPSGDERRVVMRRWILLGGALVLGFGLLTGSAHATLINVDMNTDVSPTFTGSGVLGGGTWNGVAVTGNTITTASNLLDSTGAATTVDLTLSSANLSNFDAVNGNNGPANDLLRDYGSSGGYVNIVVTISGLLPSASYDLVSYNAGDNTSQGTSISGAISGTTTSAQRTSYVEGVNYIRGTAISDGSGSLSFTVADNGTQFAMINGLQISGTVPEPSSLTMLAAVLVGLLAYVWRRRK